MIFMTRLIAILSLSVQILLISGCGTTPVKPEQEPSVSLTLENYQGYLDEAIELDEAIFLSRKLRVADFLLGKKQVDKAHSLLDTVNIQKLDSSAKIPYFTVAAKIALAEGEPYIAKRYLFNQDAESYIADANSNAAIEFYDLRSQLMFNMAEYFVAVEERLKISSYLVNDELALQLSHDIIWESLAEIPTETLYERSKTERDTIKQGWYSLAALSKSNGANFRQQIVDIQKWQDIWPDHPANSTLPADLQLILQLADQQALDLAVFLPLSGKLAGVGGAIREGIMAGYYDDLSHNNITPSIEFYDTNNQEINQLYDLALARGYELIVGPLSKENVAKLNDRESLPIPVLALNLLPKKETPLNQSAIDSNEIQIGEEDTQAHNNLFYFSLAVESEAQQVAEKAWLDGHRRALIIAPSSAWGDRGSKAFQDTWRELGGEVVSEKRFKDQRSYSSLIEASVAVDKSKNRKRELQRLIGSKLEFEPRRRKDIDFIFLLAYPKQAKQFLPLLAFHYAGDVPVYATSQVYSGETNGLSDLNGLRFSAMPWYFDNNLHERRAIQAYGDNLAPYQTLYAMGIDAYHIYPRLEQLQLIQQAQFYGTTGKLRVSSNNIIERTQNWAEVRRGSAVELKNELNTQDDM